MASVEIKYRGAADVGRKVKGHNAAVKQHLKDAIFAWHKKFLPSHFTKAAYQRYPGAFKQRFKPRTRAEYYEDVRKLGVVAANSAKAREARNKLRAPMVRTGTLERNARMKITVTGTAKKMKGAIAGSRVANFHQGNNPATGSYNMPRELTVVNAQEERVLVRQLNEAYEEFLNAAGSERTVKHKSGGI